MNGVLEEALQGPEPPWLSRFLASMGKGIRRFDMLKEGDSVTVGVSGGKDSLVLALALAIRGKHGPFHFTVRAVRVEWEEFPFKKEEAAALERYFTILELPYQVIRASLLRGGETGGRGKGLKLSCYRCARERKRLVFENAAAERPLDGRLPIVAFGHHLDDVVETTLFNLAGRGRFEPMEPVQIFLDSIKLVRPLCMVREGSVANIARRLELPVVPCVCPFAQTNLRVRTKEAIASLRQIDRLFRENIFQAAFADRWDTDGDAPEDSGNGNP